MKDAVQQINTLIDEQLPSIRALGVSVESVRSNELTLVAPIDKNHNGRGIAFGSSIYSVAMMSCYATMYLACRETIENPNIMLRDAQMRYRHPCAEPVIRAVCRNPDARQWDGFFAHFQKTGKTTLSLTSKIISNGETAAYFDGVFVLVGDN